MEGLTQWEQRQHRKQAEKAAAKKLEAQKLNRAVEASDLNDAERKDVDNALIKMYKDNKDVIRWGVNYNTSIVLDAAHGHLRSRVPNYKAPLLSTLNRDTSARQAATGNLGQSVLASSYELPQSRYPMTDTTFGTFGSTNTPPSSRNSPEVISSGEPNKYSAKSNKGLQDVTPSKPPSGKMSHRALPQPAQPSQPTSVDPVQMAYAPAPSTRGGTGRGGSRGGTSHMTTRSAAVVTKRTGDNVPVPDAKKVRRN